MTRAYYNENDLFAAQWLRNLIADDLIAPGDVDGRSIKDVRADDLRGYTQCHFFAGIGGWSLGLRIAGWEDDRHIWTGSCPCQPFSIAGNRRAFADERHLWPIWLSLIRECGPAILVGEQVASSDGVSWADSLAKDLEDAHYAFGTAILPASCVGAPHQRDRFYFAAHALGANTARWHADRWGSKVESETSRAKSYADWNGGRASYDGVADGIPASVAKRIANGFGNAVVPQLAARFIAALASPLPSHNHTGE